jgi:hypothetical protein
MAHPTRHTPKAKTSMKLGAIEERATGIEPAFSAWEADVLPLNYTRGAGDATKGAPLASGP